MKKLHWIYSEFDRTYFLLIIIIIYAIIYIFLSGRRW